MITRTIFHVLWAAAVFVFAVTVGARASVRARRAVGRRRASRRRSRRSHAPPRRCVCIRHGTVRRNRCACADRVACRDRRNRGRSAPHPLLDVLCACRRGGDGGDPRARLAAERPAPRAADRPIHDDFRRRGLRRRLRLLAAGWAERFRSADWSNARHRSPTFSYFCFTAAQATLWATSSCDCSFHAALEASWYSSQALLNASR